MLNNLKVSVVIPAYNEERYIRRCLESLGRQEVLPDEIIVVDNNCIDKTIEICKEFPVKVIQERRQGMIFARNSGFNSARYKIIARTDADAILPKDWIKKIKQNFSANNIDALGGAVFFYDLPLSLKFFWEVFVFVGGRILKGNVLIGPNMVITKNTWKKIRNKVCLNETRVHEDTDLTIHIQKNGGIINYDKSLLVGMSGRRIKNNPFSSFVEYPIRLIKTLHSHN